MQFVNPHGGVPSSMSGPDFIHREVALDQNFAKCFLKFGGGQVSLEISRNKGAYPHEITIHTKILRNLGDQQLM